MNKQDATNAIRAAFSDLTEDHKKNFRWHLENNTPVCCEKEAKFYVSEEGGG